MRASTPAPLPARTRSALTAVAAVVLCAVAGCAGQPTTQGPTTTDVSTTKGTAAFSGMVTVGGAKVYVECTGTGSPTVVFESGDEADHNQWSAVLPGVVGETRACAYDRLGTGTSDAAAGCRRAPDLLAVLEGALAAAGAGPPYVLVGTSGGGYLVVNYALAHREEVAGMLILDTFPAIDVSKAPADLRAAIRCDSASNVERRDYAAVEHAAWDHRTKLGSFPVTVISNDYGPSAENDEERSSVKGQQGWFDLDPAKARQVVVESGHNIPGNEWKLVVQEVTTLVKAGRAT